MKTKYLSFILLLVIFLNLTACTKTEEVTLKKGDDLITLPGVEFDYDNAIFDDFSTGINPDYWYIAKQAWGGSNGGVIPDNVSYTDDGILQLRGNGGYYQQGEVKGVGDVKDGRYTGAVLISNFLTGPGRYEIKMKVLPRLGACTAFWTFAYEFDQELNHEIDIELPGGNQSGVPTFANILNTNYIKETRNQSQDTKVSSLYGDEEIYLNDGRWHTFGFDWYTNPEKIVYYIDGVVCAVSDIFVPNLQTRLWFGIWFPVASAFVGHAEFESDYMLVDFVRYIPFKDQPFVEYTPAPNSYAPINEYPTIATTLKSINKVANGSFEYITELNKNISGWKLERYLDEEKEVEEVCYIQDGIGFEDSKGLTVVDGGVASQKIDAVYNKFEHTLSFKAKGNGTLTVYYYSQDTMRALKTVTLEINSTELTNYSIDLIAPSESQTMEIQFDTFNGSYINVDNVELYMK